MKKLIVGLESSVFTDREAASRELVRIGRASIPLLRNAVQNGSLEMSLRAKKLIQTLERTRFLARPFINSAPWKYWNILPPYVLDAYSIILLTEHAATFLPRKQGEH